MEIIKKKQERTFKDSKGKEHQSYAYFIKCDNGKLIMIKPVFKTDYSNLDFISNYVKDSK